MPHVCFVLHPRFQMLAYVLASESLRIGNKRAGHSLFTWETRSALSAPVEASNGRSVAPDIRGWGASTPPDLVLVIAGYDPLAVVPSGLAAFLHRADRGGAILGGIDTGVAVLASCGLLGSRSVVLHHEAEPEFRETWPEIDVIDAIYALDDRRLSAAGGTATGDAMLAWMARTRSPAFADEVVQDLVHGSMRPAAQSQRPQDTTDPILQAMRSLMLAHLESPLQVEEIAMRLGQSPRQLRSRCSAALGQTPSPYYLRLRLDHARALLKGTRMSVTEIALATGFGSHAGFSRTFRQATGVTPRAFRTRAQPGTQGR